MRAFQERCRSTLALMLLFCPAFNTAVSEADHGGAHGNAGRIHPYADNPRYWEYRGAPVLLLGGSKDDNVFQIPDLREHLDELRAAGANYVRNTMSDRKDKGYEVYPFKRLDNGKYDLNQWNPEYWERFENMLEWTSERDIIVQIEVWDRFDYSDSRWLSRWGKLWEWFFDRDYAATQRWLLHPYNPDNNVNYTARQSGLKLNYAQHPGRNLQPFFHTVPKLDNNETVLKYQMAQVDKLLSYSLRYGNVLYCIDNETSASPEWGAFWARYIRTRAQEQGVPVYITEMWGYRNPLDDHHKVTYDHPELYDFVEISQNNHNSGDDHWIKLMAVRQYLAEDPRPINTVKIYGADGGRYGSNQDAEERFWRNIFGGVAATRFHRPPTGLGLNEIATRHLKSMRLLTAELDIFNSKPDVNHRLLINRQANEAYLTTVTGSQYAIYFPNGGSVELDLSLIEGDFSLKWLDIEKTRWTPKKHVAGGRHVSLQAPGNGHWAALLTSKPNQQAELRFPIPADRQQPRASSFAD